MKRAVLTSLAILAAIALPAAPAGSSSAGSTTVLRLDGIGPLKLGMTQTAALRTGWLSNRGRGCPLGGPPVPVTYRLAGPRAPAAVRGFAEFRGGRLRNLSFTRGVRTGTGVTVGRTRAARMVARYRRAGFSASAQFVDTFRGTFVTVRRRGRTVLGGFGQGGPRRSVVRTLAIPAVAVCE